MAYRCSLCEKRPVAGNTYSHSHKASNRVFRPNLHKQKMVLDGKTVSAYVCTRCIKAGKAIRPKV
ncbi:MAG: 50S ribosomal protein L28 [Elusimicrobia bacterium GWA2_69_24]|nr:MAG: 50S ribosomal protein L28 [Elusimicrobia bacterium GWA2_69_24]HBL18985.1 50S ribosomal protein L28 [Elusimicrobiota bacterium]